MKTVVITGGTKGLGRELSLAFGRGGYFPVVLYSADEAAADRLSCDFAGFGAAGVVLRHNVCCEDASVWNRAEIQDAEQLVLIHNACAPFTPQPMHQLTWDDFEKNLSVAVKGAWFCTQPLIRVLLKKKGAIVNVLTAAIDDLPPKGFAAYAVAKSALEGFTRALASEYSPRGLKVFSISPGYMDTSLTAQWDVRLRTAIRQGSHRVTSTVEAAKRVVELVESHAVAGNGEDYSV